MTEKKKTAREKAVKDAPVAKKTTLKETVKKEVVEKPTPKQPVRAKKVKVDRDEMIPCRSMTAGTLVYISDRTRARFLWNDFGTVQYIEMGELLDMRASAPSFLEDIMLIVEDDEAVDMLGLTKKYESLSEFEGLDDILFKSASELKDILPELPKGIKRSLTNRARALIENGELESLNVIRAIEVALKVDLKMFTE